MSVIVYDKGMLIGLVEKNRRARALHAGFVAAGGHVPIVPGPALAQAWRTSPKTAYAWSRLLAEVFVHPGARTLRPGEPSPRCLPCAGGFATGDWQTLGDMIGLAALPPKQPRDPVDALCVLLAAKHAGSAVITSAPDNIEAYAATLNDCQVTVVKV